MHSRLRKSLVQLRPVRPLSGLHLRELPNDLPGTPVQVARDSGPLGFEAQPIDRSYTLHKTYAPVDVAKVLDVDDARVRGRRRMRANKAGAFVSTPQSGNVSTPGKKQP